jgi:hypothetical protein
MPSEPASYVGSRCGNAASATRMEKYSARHQVLLTSTGKHRRAYLDFQYCTACVPSAYALRILSGWQTVG